MSFFIAHVPDYFALIFFRVKGILTGDMRKMFIRSLRNKQHKSIYQPALTEEHELDAECYTAFVLIKLFSAHYLPWLKQRQFQAKFDDRLDQLVNLLEYVSAQFCRVKHSVVDLAKGDCGNVKRLLNIVITDMCTSSDKRRIKAVDKVLRLRVFSRDQEGQASKFYHSDYTLPVQLNSSMYLEIPVSYI